MTAYETDNRDPSDAQMTFIFDMIASGDITDEALSQDKKLAELLTALETGQPFNRSDASSAISRMRNIIRGVIVPTAAGTAVSLKNWDDIRALALTIPNGHYAVGIAPSTWRIQGKSHFVEKIVRLQAGDPVPPKPKWPSRTHDLFRQESARGTTASARFNEVAAALIKIAENPAYAAVSFELVEKLCAVCLHTTDACGCGRHVVALRRS